MNELLMAEILTSDSDEIAELRANASTLEKFINLARKIESMPDIQKRFYEENRSLYQATLVGRKISELESILKSFFGEPAKAAGAPLARKLKKNSSVKYLGGIQKEQTLFLLSLKTGEFYGALWPWQREKNKIELHLGYCSDWITDEDYEQIDTFIKRCLSRSAFESIDMTVGGQIHGTNLPSFLQMAEMERTSFCLRITSGNKNGRLYMTNGKIVDARTDDLAGRQAAYQIISWENVSILIAPAEEDRKDEIKQPLMHVLMESLKQKDEQITSGGPPTAPKPPRRPTKTEVEASKNLIRLERAHQPKAPEKKRRLTKPLAVALVVLLIGVGALFMAGRLKSNQGRSAEYQYKTMLEQVEKAESVQEKLVLLENYLNIYPPPPHLDEVKNKISKITQTLQEQEFEQITLAISKLQIDENYEKEAIALYSQFMKKHPDTPLAERVNKAIAGIKDLIDQFYYEELKRAALLDFKERQQIYRDYLEQFPRGTYRKDVSVLIEKMGAQYFDFLKTGGDQCEKNKNWDPCIERCQAFIESYSGTKLMEEAVALKKQWSDRRDLENLRRSAQEAGNDFQKAYNSYQGYLNRHPQTTEKAAIENDLEALEKQLAGQRAWMAVRAFVNNPSNPILKKIQRLDHYIQNNLSGPYAADAQSLLETLERERQVALRQQQVEAKKQEELARLQREREKRAQQEQRAREITAQLEIELNGSQRFRSNADGSFTDLTSGLAWTILDSYQALGGCLSYEDAQKYVGSLSTAGQTDWRLPTASELAGILKQAPFFPASGAEWYWSSESYAKGFHTVANIVSAKQETIYTREFRKISECGSVRAVRP